MRRYPGLMTMAVVTDSGACLPSTFAAAHGITVVDLHTVPAAGQGAAPTTAGPSVEELAEAYEAALGHADTVLALHLSAALSGTVDSARLAAGRIGGDRVRVLDSGTVGGGLGLAALAAATASDLRHGVALARETAGRATVLLVVEDLGHLRRGGRIDRSTALLGSALGVRPVLTVSEGRLTVAETVRGGARARRHVVERAVHAAGGSGLVGPRPPADPVLVAVHHCHAPQAAEELEEDLARALGASGARVDALLRAAAGPAIEVHTGPGALAVSVAPALAEIRIQPEDD